MVLSRLRVWKRLAFGVADHFWAGVRLGRKADQDLEAYFNKFDHRIVGLPKHVGEPVSSFVIRLNSVTSWFESDAKIDVRFRHALKLVTWVEHMYRHKEMPPFKLLCSQSDGWLETCRYLIGQFGASRTPEAGETGTRAEAEVPLRWAAGWVERMASREGGWENAVRAKGVSLERAQFLLDNLIKRPSRRLAMME